MASWARAIAPRPLEGRLSSHGSSGETTILVVEDDAAIAAALARLLAEHGYSPVVATSGRAALDHVSRLPPAAVLLDLGLPDLDGVHVCRQLRQTAPQMTIVILTARDADVDVVVGLDAGANDYVVKPFSTHVLLARLRAHLRDAPEPPAAAMVFGELHIDVEAYRAFLSGVELGLRPKEMALLIRLASCAGRVVSRDLLLEDVWDVTWETGSKTLDVHIHALRRKLGPRPDGRGWISTVRSLGYRFEP